MNDMQANTTSKQPFHLIILLILAAEAVFILPFVLQRIFRPTFLEIFSINNEQIGYCFSVYGFVALFSYVFGGPLADKFQPKNLMAIALLLTAFGGFYLATFPKLSYLYWLYGYWGFTTIFLFWAAMIKATRVWGGKNKQGIAFGFLDGGRGLMAAGIGSLSVLIFSIFLTVDPTNASIEEKQYAFRQVILTCSYLIICIAILMFFVFKTKENISKTETNGQQRINFSTIKQLLKLPTIWLLMVIILCAYTGYKASDLFTLYATDVMKYDAIESAGLGTALLYIRPVIGVAIGFAADRTKPSLWLIVGFLLTTIASLIFSLDIINNSTHILFFINIMLIAVGIYSCRVLYFATLEEANIPIKLTGTAIGLISVVGYTPDIFSGPLFGILVDNPNKVLGLQHAFLVLIIFSLVGALASLLLNRFVKRT